MIHKSKLKPSNPKRKDRFEGIGGLTLVGNKLFYERKFIGTYEKIGPESFQEKLYKGSIYLVDKIEDKSKRIRGLIGLLGGKKYCIITNQGVCA